MINEYNHLSYSLQVSVPKIPQMTYYTTEVCLAFSNGGNELYFVLLIVIDTKCINA